MRLSLPTGRVLPALLVAAATAAFALPAAARSAAPTQPDDLVTIYVPTQGLNLAQSADLRRLRHRIDLAVDQICGDPWNMGLDESMRVDVCRRHIVHSAEPQVDALVRRDVQFAAARTAARPAG
jgi:UrcA family protein